MSTSKKGITVRFEDHEMKQIDDLAAKYSVSSATIIRWGVKALADCVAANNGQITLPLDFTAFFRKAETSAHDQKTGYSRLGSSILNEEPVVGANSGKRRGA